MKKHKASILIAVFIFLISVSGCMGTISEKNSVTSNPPEPEAQSRFQEVYRQELPENVLCLRWLSDTQVYWVTENYSTDRRTYALYIADVGKGTESLVFERSLEAGHELDMSVELSDNQLYLFLCDISDSQTYSKVTLSTTDWKVLSEKPLNVIRNISWPRKSKQDIVVGQDIMTGRKGTFNWEIILYPLESPERLYSLKQFSETRYDFTGIIWSPSGEYFILANNDAFGLDRFESMADLIGYPKGEWPTALQYDVFKKDGSFAFSFPVDFVFKEDGSESSFDMYWMPEDQIYISSTFYDAALNKKQSKDQVINSSGIVVYEKAYEGDRNYFSGVNFVNRGVYYNEKREDATHLMQLSFPSGEITDYGLIAVGDDRDWVSATISPNETFVLLQNNQNRTIRILELKK